jgi:RNA polymerase sigma factor for flagellar operon FliA
MVYGRTEANNGIDIETHAPLVKRIAQHMVSRMPASVQLGDLIQAGMIAKV